MNINSHHTKIEILVYIQYKCQFDHYKCPKFKL